MNLSLYVGIFPDTCKIGLVKPLHKKDDKTLKMIPSDSVKTAGVNILWTNHKFFGKYSLQQTVRPQGWTYSIPDLCPWHLHWSSHRKSVHVCWWHNHHHKAQRDATQLEIETYIKVNCLTQFYEHPTTSEKELNIFLSPNFFRLTSEWGTGCELSGERLDESLNWGKHISQIESTLSKGLLSCTGWIG